MKKKKINHCASEVAYSKSKILPEHIICNVNFFLFGCEATIDTTLLGLFQRQVHKNNKHGNIGTWKNQLIMTKNPTQNCFVNEKN